MANDSISIRNISRADANNTRADFSGLTGKSPIGGGQSVLDGLLSGSEGAGFGKMLDAEVRREPAQAQRQTKTPQERTGRDSGKKSPPLAAERRSEDTRASSPGTQPRRDSTTKAAGASRARDASAGQSSRKETVTRKEPSVSQPQAANKAQPASEEPSSSQSPSASQAQGADKAPVTDQARDSNTADTAPNPDAENALDKAPQQATLSQTEAATPGGAKDSEHQETEVDQSLADQANANVLLAMPLPVQSPLSSELPLAMNLISSPDVEGETTDWMTFAQNDVMAGDSRLVTQYPGDGPGDSADLALAAANMTGTFNKAGVFDKAAGAANADMATVSLEGMDPVDAEAAVDPGLKDLISALLQARSRSAEGKQGAELSPATSLPSSATAGAMAAIPGGGSATLSQAPGMEGQSMPPPITQVQAASNQATSTPFAAMQSLSRQAVPAQAASMSATAASLASMQAGSVQAPVAQALPMPVAPTQAAILQANATQAASMQSLSTQGTPLQAAVAQPATLQPAAMQSAPGQATPVQVASDVGLMAQEMALEGSAVIDVPASSLAESEDGVDLDLESSALEGLADDMFSLSPEADGGTDMTLLGRQGDGRTKEASLTSTGAQVDAPPQDDAWSILDGMAEAEPAPHQKDAGGAAKAVSPQVQSEQQMAMLRSELRNLERFVQAGMPGVSGVTREASAKEEKNGEVSQGSLTRALESLTANAKANETRPGPTLPNTPVAFGRPGFTEQMAQKIMLMTTQNIQSADIRLDPQEMGTIEIKIRMHKDQASVVFSSPHAPVRDALEQSIPRLREMFADSGLGLGNVNVSDRGSSSAGGDQPSRGQSGDEMFARGEEVVDERPQTLARAPKGLVDYYA